MQDAFFQLSLIIITVLVVSFITRFLRQPLIIGYIISGILTGPFFLNTLPEGNTLTIFSKMGVAFLLFIVGLNLSPKVIKDLGKMSVLLGITQIIFTSIIAYFLSIILGFNLITSLYLGIALTFSSTIIVLKLLSDKDALEKLYGKISIGVLLFQDFIAIIFLIIASSFSSENATTVILFTLFKGFVLLSILFFILYLILPKMNYFITSSQEFLFIFSIAWGLGLASVFQYIGFSLEAGALIAGIILSMTPYNFEISSKLRPLRDFFIISFFVLLGSQIIFSELTNKIFLIIVLSLFVLFVKPLIVMILMGLFGYNKNSGFMSGVSLAQISEFSLIIISLGVSLGHIQTEITSIITIISLITIAGSTYMITFSDKFYPRLSKFLNIFERKGLKKNKIKTKDYSYFLFGENRIGFSIMKSFKKFGRDFLVVDYDPEVVKRLSLNKIPCVYGDISDIDFLEELRIDKAKIIVSTVPEKETNLLILNFVKQKNNSIVVIVAAREISEAFELYKNGADYVILPHFLGGEYAAKIIEKEKDNKLEYKKYRLTHIKELNERLLRGHEHPNVNKK